MVRILQIGTIMVRFIGRAFIEAISQLRQSQCLR
jgi:hypothetical protein